MKKTINYLVRKLAVIRNDSQFQIYDVVYVRGVADDGVIRDLTIADFKEELPGVEYIDTLSLRETTPGIWVKA